MFAVSKEGCAAVIQQVSQPAAFLQGALHTGRGVDAHTVWMD